MTYSLSCASVFPSVKWEQQIVPVTSQPLGPWAAHCPGWAGQELGALLWQTSTSVTGSHVETGPARTLLAPTTASASLALWWRTTETAWVSHVGWQTGLRVPHWKWVCVLTAPLWNKGPRPRIPFRKTTPGNWKWVNHKVAHTSVFRCPGSFARAYIQFDERQTDSGERKVNSEPTPGVLWCWHFRAVVKSMDSKVKWVKFKSFLCHLATVWP